MKCASTDGRSPDGNALRGHEPLKGRRSGKRCTSLIVLTLILAAASAFACSPDSAQEPKAGGAVVVVGLDGADWSIVDRLRDEGRLPNFSRLIAEGARGELDTLRPTLSPAIWTTIATGRLPADHGVVDFYTASDRVRVKRLWEIALEYGRKAGVLSYIVTWPPDDALSFAIPGWLAQDGRTHPPELAFVKRFDAWLTGGEDSPGLLALARELPTLLLHDVSARTLRALLSAVWLEARSADPDRVGLQKLRASIALETDVFCHLLRTTEPDLALFYNHEIDSVGHRYFKYYYPSRFPSVSEEEASAYGDALPSMYEASDAALGRIRSCAGEGARLVVVSDHGQRPSFGEGQAAISIRYGRLLEGLGLEDALLGTHVGRGVQLRAVGPEVDLERAAALLRGVVALPDEHSIFRIEQRPGGFVLRPAIRFEPDRKIRLGADRVPMSTLLSEGRRVSGQHTKTALVLLHGPGIAPGKRLPRGHVLDVAPTVLGLLDLPIAHDMPGRFIEEALDDDARARLSLHWVDTYGASPAYVSPDFDGRLVPAKIEELRELGYVE